MLPSSHVTFISCLLSPTLLLPSLLVRLPPLPHSITSPPAHPQHGASSVNCCCTLLPVLLRTILHTLHIQSHLHHQQQLRHMSALQCVGEFQVHLPSPVGLSEMPEPLSHLGCNLDAQEGPQLHIRDHRIGLAVVHLFQQRVEGMKAAQEGIAGNPRVSNTPCKALG